jgi:hypothetical protein
MERNLLYPSDALKGTTLPLLLITAIGAGAFLAVGAGAIKTAQYFAKFFDDKEHAALIIEQQEPVTHPRPEAKNNNTKCLESELER